MKDILQNWGLSEEVVKIIDSPSKSTWDIGGKYILKHISNSNELIRSIQFVELLAAEGIPVATFIPLTNGNFTTPDNQWALMSKLTGEHVNFYIKPNLAFEFGKELAHLHLTLAHIESKIVCVDCDFLSDWHNSIKPNIYDIVAHDLIDQFEILFFDRYPKLPHQLIHRDVHCFNFLFDDNQLSGWLDFDLGQRNVRVFDLAYFLVGLLVGENLDIDKVAIWDSIYSKFIAGYSEVNQINDYEINAIPLMMIAIEFLFASYWKHRGNMQQTEQALSLAIWLCDRYISKNQHSVSFYDD